MTKYSIDKYSEKTGWESLALMSDAVPISAMADFCRELSTDPTIGGDDFAVTDVDTGEVVWCLSDDEPDYPEDDYDECGYNPYLGCYDYDC